MGSEMGLDISITSHIFHTKKKKALSSRHSKFILNNQPHVVDFKKHSQFKGLVHPKIFSLVHLEDNTMFNNVIVFALGLNLKILNCVPKMNRGLMGLE